mmetsp:Transcript_24099/g.59125  ORF Transcript_24099/g.59125 Transcript_24099/m.59125 type:complete len:207 (+) Transcript_24099:323-943(+)
MSWFKRHRPFTTGGGRGWLGTSGGAPRSACAARLSMAPPLPHRTSGPTATTAPRSRARSACPRRSCSSAWPRRGDALPGTSRCSIRCTPRGSRCCWKYNSSGWLRWRHPRWARSPPPLAPPPPSRRSRERRESTRRWRWLPSTRSIPPLLPPPPPPPMRAPGEDRRGHSGTRCGTTPCPLCARAGACFRGITRHTTASRGRGSSTR